MAQPGHWQVNPHEQPEPASVVKVLKGGTTGVGLGTSGKSSGGRSSAGAGVEPGDAGVAPPDRRRDESGEVCPSASWNEAICSG